MWATHPALWILGLTVAFIVIGFVQASRAADRRCLLILQLLDTLGPDYYGLTLLNMSDGKLLRGALYVDLDRLESAGYVASREETDSEHEKFSKHLGIRRRKFRITKLGREFLALRKKSP